MSETTQPGDAVKRVQLHPEAALAAVSDECAWWKNRALVLQQQHYEAMQVSTRALAEVERLRGELSAIKADLEGLQHPKSDACIAADENWHDERQSAADRETVN